MFSAKYEKDGQVRWLSADDYDAAHHSDIVLTCSDHDCSAHVHFRHAGQSKKTGEVVSRPHFATFDDQMHRDDCDEDFQIPVAKRISTLRDALVAEKKIVIDIGFHAGFREPLHKDFQTAANGNIPLSKKYLACARQGWQNDCYEVMADSTQDFIEIIARIYRIAPENFAHSFVEYRGQIRPLDNVLVWRDEEKIRKMFYGLRDAKNAVAVKNNDLYGFPRLMFFVPTQRTVDGKHPQLVGTSQKLDTKQGQSGRVEPLILTHTMFAKKKTRDVFPLRDQTMICFATPIFDQDESGDKINRWEKRVPQSPQFISVQLPVNVAGQLCDPQNQNIQARLRTMGINVPHAPQASPKPDQHTRAKHLAPTA